LAELMSTMEGMDAAVGRDIALWNELQQNIKIIPIM
jgi:hypothetical protein